MRLHNFQYEWIPARHETIFAIGPNDSIDFCDITKKKKVKNSEHDYVWTNDILSLSTMYEKKVFLGYQEIPRCFRVHVVSSNDKQVQASSFQSTGIM